MKKTIIHLVILAIVFACNNDDDGTSTDLIGTFKLIEVLADPGDGSGVFRVVNSNKIIQFRGDGTVASNGELCSFSIEPNNPSSGTYSVTDTTITTSNCSLTFEQNGNEIILNYLCIEACRGKFLKL